MDKQEIDILETVSYSPHSVKSTSISNHSTRVVGNE